MTAREDALVPGARIDDDVIRLDLIEAEAPAGWREAFTGSPGAGRRRRVLVAMSLGLAATDVVCILLAMALAGVVAARSAEGASVNPLLMLCVALGWLALFTAHGLYRPLGLAPHDEFRRLLGATSLGSLILATVVFVVVPEVPRSWPLVAWLSVLILEGGARACWRKMQDRLRRSGPLSLRTVIVGANAEARRLAGELGMRGSGYQVLGHVGLSEGAAAEIPFLGTVGDLRTVIRRVGADCLFVASTALDRSTGAAVAQVARQERVRLCYGANLPPTLAWRLGFEQINGSVAVTVSPAGLTTPRGAIKRAMDVVISSTFLLITAPIFGATALAIRATSRGPVLFRQTRVTKAGRTFTMLKFRTMGRDADTGVRELELDSTQPFFKLREDPRLTPVGRLIRRLSLDELPQLLNVFRGDMSIVGPRPLPAEQVATHLDLLGPRHEVRAGLTGWWQINGRADLTPEESVKMDLFYIENWSPSLDLYIMLKTFGAVLSGRGAY